MYNSLQKERYIAEKESETILPTGFLDRMFRKTEPEEENLGKDVSQFTTAEILNLYKIINFRSIDSLVNYHFQLSNYGNWCLQQNLVLDGINHFNELNVDILNTCINKTALESSIIDGEKLLEIVSRLKNPRDKFVLMMLFETGKSKNQENLFKAKLSDIDEEAGTMKLFDGRVVNVSRQLINIAKSAASEDDYYLYDPSPNLRKETRPLVDSGTIYKETSLAVNTDPIPRMARLNNGMNTALTSLGYKKKWIKLNAFAESGIISAIKELMEENDMTAEQVLKDRDLRNEINNQHNANIRSVATFLRKYQDVL